MQQGRGRHPIPGRRRHRRYVDGHGWTGNRILTRSAFRRRTAGVIGAAVVVLVAAFVVVGLLAPQPNGTAADRNDTTAEATAAATATTAATPGSSPRGTALAAAERLPVKGRAPKTGYSRDQFGSAWVDTDGNGCDQREDVLNRDLVDKTFDGCRVLTGTLHDPYTGRVIRFHRGQVTSAAVQIDHVVALSDAWQKGAQQWTAAKRLRFATDTLNLFAVDGPTNASKGDGDAATWLPPNKRFRCTYVAHQVAVKKQYGLWVTAAERAAMVRVLSGCSSMKLPTRTAIPSRRG
jgi:hypothetical protein